MLFGLDGSIWVVFRVLESLGGNVITYSASGGVATVTIDDPDRRNPLSNEAMHELQRAVDRSAEDPDVRVVVVTGAGERAFSAGGDLTGGFVDRPLSDHGSRGALGDLFRAMRVNPKPIVGRVNGVALGGGFGLAVACDITIAKRGARMGTPEIDLGLWPMMISTILSDVAPRKRLLEMMLVGTIIDADEAEQLGLVTRVADADDFDEAVDSIVVSLLAKSSAALALGKRSFYSMVDMDADTALDHLQIGLTATAQTQDAAEGVAAFLEKRPPDWTGR